MHGLVHESRKVGLKVNKTKTKVTANRSTTTKIDDDHLENVNSYRYLGNLVKNDSHHEQEISRRLGVAWCNFGKLYKYLQQPQRFPFT